MTERGKQHVKREAGSFAVGPSSLRWTGQSLNIDMDERSVPLPRRVKGRVIVHPLGLSSFTTPLDAAGQHRWGPIAPCARIEVNLQHPGLQWKGHAYLDSNEGDEPIERAFTRWDWLRAPLADGRCAVLYDVQPCPSAKHPSPQARLIGARFAADGSVSPFTLHQRQRLPPTRWWKLDRRTPIDTAPAFVVQTLEDTPFYARSLLRMSLGGEPADAMHETLDVTRLRSTAVQCMLPWRMPRVA